MSQIDKEMWQDFVVEANENLEELEPNLLLLENDPKNISLLNDCFRNMHSIKGAAGYMGLEAISSLAHSVENLFDKVRQGELSLSPEDINLIFAAIDRIRALIKEVSESNQEKSQVEDLLKKIDDLISTRSGNLSEGANTSVQPSRIQAQSDTDGGETGIQNQDEDLELMEIFAEEIKSLYQQLQQLTHAHPIAKDALLTVLNNIERVTNYIGLDELLEEIVSIKGRIDKEEDNTLDADKVRELIKETGKVLERHIPSFSMMEENQDRGELGLEEDEELYKIFLDFVKENSGPLANTPTTPDETWLKECQESVEKLKTSAHYMDYPDIVALFEEWGERLAESLSKYHEEKKFDPGPFKELWTRLVERLPELGSIEPTPLKEDLIEEEFEAIGEEPIVENLESAIDQLFDNQDLFGEGTDPDNLPFPTEIDTALEQAESVQSTQHENTAAAPSASEQIADSEPQEQLEKPSAPPSQTVRIDLDRVEHLLRDVGELVVLRSGLTQAAEEMKATYKEWMEKRLLDTKHLKRFKDAMIRLNEQAAALGRVVHNLQDGVMRMRMLPVRNLFNRYPRMIRDLCQKLDKKVNLNVIGAETALDKRVIEEMADPMLHIIRNAIDHGIEPPDTREKLGKPATGTRTLSASQEGNYGVIKGKDDGKGLDREGIIRRAVSLGLIGREEAQTLPDEKVWELIFLPGITTAESVSETSGRGVGMDVVKRNVEKLGGVMKIRSVPGRETEITVRIPLTLAIIPTLLTRVGHQVMAIPISAVQETFRIRSDEISTVEGFEIISLRQDTLPLIRLSRIFRGTGADENPEKLFVVRIKQGEVEAGLAVDGFIGQQEVVIKPLAEYLTDQPGFSGATILGDGSIALILDIPVMLDKAKKFTVKRQQLLEKSALEFEEISNTIH